MRLKRNRLQTLHHKSVKIEKDSEGGVITTYGSADSLSCEVWPAGGKIQAEMYGERLSYIKNIRLNGKYEIQSDENGRVHYICEGVDLMEGDGLCIYVSEEQKPDYRIISIKPYRFLRLEAEKLE